MSDIDGETRASLAPPFESIESGPSVEGFPVVPPHKLPAADDSPTFLQQQWHRLRDDIRNPLYRNAYALMLSTILTSLLGIIYTVVVAHAYTDAQVGKAQAGISTVQLISSLTQLNFMQVLMRFLPRAGTRSKQLIVWCYGISASLAVAVTVPLLLIANHAAPRSSALHTTIGFGLLFTLTTGAWSVFNLQDSTLTGLRRAVWVPVENGIFGAVKILFLIGFAPFLGASGIFAAWTIPVVFSLIPVNYAIFRRFLPRHTEESASREQSFTPGSITRFVAGDYVGNIFAQMSTTLLPIIVLTQTDKQTTAYFVMAQIIGQSLDLASMNLASSLTVEAAMDETRVRELGRSVMRRIMAIVVPAAVVLVLIAPIVLSMYGSHYSKHATTLLRFLAIASIPRAMNVVWTSLARVHHRTHLIGFFQAGQSSLLVGLSMALLNSRGIAGVGEAAIVSQTVVAAVIAPSLYRWLRPKHDPQYGPPAPMTDTPRR